MGILQALLNTPEHFQCLFKTKAGGGGMFKKKKKGLLKK